MALSPVRLFPWFIFASSLIQAVCARLDKRAGHVDQSNHHRNHDGYKTEPGFFPQRFSKVFKTDDEASLGRGYIFLAMMQSGLLAWGPQIYDDNGEIVWYGRPQVDRYRVADFHVCEYLGSKDTHLCWHERKPNPDPNREHPFLEKVIVDNTYALVHNFSTDGNGHEFNMVDGGRKFVTMDYKKRTWDLRPYCGGKRGCIHDGCILEYDAVTGQEIFRWCLSEHFPVHETKLFFTGHPLCQKNDTTYKAGAGTRQTPWDVAHLNAVDKNSDGNYVGSFRHMDEIICIAGPNSTSGAKSGEVLWVLGGRSNQFEKSFSFSRQHMVRYFPRSESRNDSKTVITLFNNAWEGILRPSSKMSSGQIIELDTEKMTARLLNEFPHPKGKLAASRGSMQALPNGNAFIGWGTVPEVSEHSSNGTLLYHAEYASHARSQFSYRAFKSPWVGKPPWPPKLVAYSYRCGKASPLYAYVSWNGQTEVHQWRFDTGVTSQGPWLHAGTFDKTGFETKVKLGDSTALFVTVSGLDANGEILGTAMEATFVPQPAIRNKCGPQGCKPGFAYNADARRRQTCDAKYAPVIVPFILLILFLEGFTSCFNQIIASAWQSEEVSQTSDISDADPLLFNKVVTDGMDIASEHEPKVANTDA